MSGEAYKVNPWHLAGSLHAEAVFWERAAYAVSNERKNLWMRAASRQFDATTQILRGDIP